MLLRVGRLVRAGLPAVVEPLQDVLAQHLRVRRQIAGVWAAEDLPESVDHLRDLRELIRLLRQRIREKVREFPAQCLIEFIHRDSAGGQERIAHHALSHPLVAALAT